MTRRDMLVASGIALSVGSLGSFSSCITRKSHSSTSRDKRDLPFRISLNSSTIRDYKLPVDQQIELCAEAGFDGIELWVDDVEKYIQNSGSPETLNRQIKQLGLVLENMITFSTWMADDPLLQAKGVRKMHRDMELTARLGGSYIAAPVQGLSSIERDRLPIYADRYQKLLHEGDQRGVTPLIELWGGGAANQLSDVTAIAIGAAHPKASLLLDFYHLHKGDNSFDSLRMLNGKMLPLFHINDYPGDISRESLKDSDRIFPGEGICPFHKVIPLLYQTGFRGAFSVELFNTTYSNAMDVKDLLKHCYHSTCAVIYNNLPKSRK